MLERNVLFLCACLFSAGCASPPPPHAAPIPVPAGTVRYAIGGDSRNDASNVLPWALDEARARGVSAFLFLGDMELSPGFDDRFAKALGALDTVPFFPVLGNHEVLVFGFLNVDPRAEERKFRTRFLDRPRTPVKSSIPDKVVYSVDLPGGLHFIALDNVSQSGFGDEQLRWLAADLENVKGSPSVKHIVVGMHKPLAGNGVSAHGMDADGDQAIADSNAALAVFEAGHVEMIVASHVHQFAAFTQGGIQSYITGGLGAPLTASGVDHAFHHFLELDISDEGMRVGVVRFPGKPSLSTGDEGD